MDPFSVSVFIDCDCEIEFDSSPAPAPATPQAQAQAQRSFGKCSSNNPNNFGNWSLRSGRHFSCPSTKSGKHRFVMMLNDTSTRRPNFLLVTRIRAGSTRSSVCRASRSATRTRNSSPSSSTSSYYSLALCGLPLFQMDGQVSRPRV